MTEPVHPSVRPTKRCLDDLGLKFPPIDEPLSELAHPLIRRAQILPAEVSAGGAERIKVLADRVWFKVKTSNLRGAAIELAGAETPVPHDSEPQAFRWWLGAAGERKDDSHSDFYRAIESEYMRSASSDHLMPQDIDWRRLSAELATQFTRTIRRVVREAVARSLRDGKQWAAMFTGYSVGAWVNAHDGDAYLAICAEGFVDPKVIAVILDSVPTLTADDWMAEPQEVLGIKPGPGQIVYSTIIPPSAQAAILDECELTDD